MVSGAFLVEAIDQLADAYLELRLLPEALKLFDAAVSQFAALELPDEQAWALMQSGRARVLLRTRVVRQCLIGRTRHRLALELLVRDNGPGVPEPIRDRIFDPLVSGRDGGTGLGLTLAQDFVLQHQGTIECDSTPGRTDFRILIPLP